MKQRTPKRWTHTSEIICSKSKLQKNEINWINRGHIQQINTEPHKTDRNVGKAPSLQISDTLPVDEVEAAEVWAAEVEAEDWAAEVWAAKVEE